MLPVTTDVHGVAAVRVETVNFASNGGFTVKTFIAYAMDGSILAQFKTFGPKAGISVTFEEAKSEL